MPPNIIDENADVAPDSSNEPNLLQGEAERNIGTQRIITAIRLLIASDQLPDQVDKDFLTGAASFLEAPTDNLADINLHAANVSDVLGGFMMKGESEPKEVDEMNLVFCELICEHHINAVKKSSDPAIKKTSLEFALKFAKMIAKDYHKDALLKEVEALNA